MPYSRTSSKDKVATLQRPGSAAYTPIRDAQRTQRRSIDESRNTDKTRKPSIDETRNIERPRESTALGLLSSAGSASESSSSSSNQGIAQSHAFSRRPHFASARGKEKAPLNMLSSTEEDVEDEDDSPAFLPLSTQREQHDARFSNETTRVGKSSALSSRPSDHARRERPGRTRSSSSSRSRSSQAQPSSSIPSISSQGANPLRANVWATLPPKQRRVAHDESEGTPSMGSSFSDLDDASLTQSALEEALAREMRAGKGSLAVVSRIGGLWKGQGPNNPAASSRFVDRDKKT